MDESTRAELERFREKFPEVYREALKDPKGAIPDEVWARVDRGESLTDSYDSYERGRRGTGSMLGSGGTDHRTDAFLAGLNEEGE